MGSRGWAYIFPSLLSHSELHFYASRVAAIIRGRGLHLYHQRSRFEGIAFRPVPLVEGVLLGIGPY